MRVELSLLPHQKRLLNSTSPFVFAVFGRGSGKSYTLSIIALLSLLQGKNAILCAQRYDSLKDVLFREIKLRVAEWGLADYVQFKENPVRAMYNGHILYGGSFDAVDSLRGLTEISLLILDECALAPLDILDVLAPCLRGPGVENPRIIGATTPNAKSQWNFKFAEAYKYGWEIITATTYDNKFLTQEQIRIIEQAIPSQAMRDQELNAKIVTGGAASAIIKLEEFPTIPGLTTDTRVIAGLDLSQGVDRDASAFVVRKGRKILEMVKWYDKSHEDIVHYIQTFSKQIKIDKLNIDIAMSEYVFNVLKYEMPCEQIPFGSAPSDEGKSNFANKRAEMYANTVWEIQHGLCVDGFDLTGELKRELCMTTWERMPNGKFILCKKDELRQILGASPDIADALALTCVNKWNGDDPVMNSNRGGNGLSRAEEEEIMSEY